MAEHRRTAIPVRVDLLLVAVHGESAVEQGRGRVTRCTRERGGSKASATRLCVTQISVRTALASRKAADFANGADSVRFACEVAYQIRNGRMNRHAIRVERLIHVLHVHLVRM